MILVAQSLVRNRSVRLIFATLSTGDKPSFLVRNSFLLKPAGKPAQEAASTTNPHRVATTGLLDT